MDRSGGAEVRPEGPKGRPGGAEGRPEVRPEGPKGRPGGAEGGPGDPEGRPGGRPVSNTLYAQFCTPLF